MSTGMAPFATPANIPTVIAATGTSTMPNRFQRVLPLPA